MGMIGNYIMADELTLRRIKSGELSMIDYAYSDDLDDEKYLDIDKAWHAIHFTLTGKVYDFEPSNPLSYVVLGGETINSEDMGYGPATMFTPAQVMAAHEGINKIDEAGMRSMFSIPAMQQAGIYPVQPNEDAEEFFEYVWGFFECVQDFYKRAAEAGMHVLFYVN